MRNRTELKTTTVEGSDYEDEVSDGDDSGEDWQPEKDDGSKGKKGAVAKVGSAKKTSAAAGKRKAPAAKSPKGGATKKKAKKESSDEEEEDEEDMEDSDEDFDDSDEEEEDVKNGDGSKKKRTTKKGGDEPNGMKTLYVKKLDLKDGLLEKQDLFMWKRDGSSLLQRFKQNKTDKKDDYIFTPTTVYSCWEDRRKDEYFEVKTKSAAGGDGQVTIVDKEEFAKFIEQSKSYEKPESEEENEDEGEGDENTDENEDEEGSDES